MVLRYYTDGEMYFGDEDTAIFYCGDKYEKKTQEWSLEDIIDFLGLYEEVENEPYTGTYAMFNVLYKRDYTYQRIIRELGETGIL